MFDIQLFGGFQVRVRGKTIRGFRSNSVRALLTYLCIEHGRPHTRESIATLLRSDATHGKALHSLRTTIYRLRQVLDKASPSSSQQLMTVSRKSLEWHHLSALLTIDTHQLAAAAASAETATVAQLSAAISLYTDEFLKGFHVGEAEAFDAWLLIRREQYHQQAMMLLTTLGTKALEARSWQTAIDAARRQLELEAWHEAAFRRWMIATAQLGNRTAALALYDRCCDVLADELGVSPSNETHQLFEQLRDGQRGRPPVSYVADSRLSAEPQHNLPQPLTRMVNREDEAVDVVQLLQSAEKRWVTLIGAGGIGKSRLAIIVGQALLSTFPDGVWFVPMAQLQPSQRTREEIATRLATEMGLSLQGKGPVEAQLTSMLREHTLLVIFDNFEHLHAAADIVPALLVAIPKLRVLCTSRLPLDFMAETVYPLSGLRMPENTEADLLNYPAIQLFVDRAQHSNARFRLTADSMSAVLDICRFVGGNPLGIELAASAVRHRSPAKIFVQLQASYKRLSTRLRDVPLRHRSMDTVLRDSWTLLDESEREALTSLSIFRGGFSAEAAHTICDADQSMLEWLVDRSLLQHWQHGRFGMHEVLRQFSAERAPQRAVVSTRHTAFYLEFLACRAKTLQRDQPLEAAAAIDIEFGNISSAWQAGLMNANSAAILNALSGLSNLYQLRGRSQEAVHQFSELVRSFRPNAKTDHTAAQIVARGLVEQGRFLNRLTRCQEAFSAAQAALPLAKESEDGWVQTMGRVVSAEALWRQGRYADARQQLDHVTVAHDQNKTVVAWYHYHLGVINTHDNQFDTALANYQSALDYARATRHLAQQATTLNGMAMTLANRGDYQQSKPYLLEAIDIFDRVANVPGKLWTFNNLARVFIDEKQYAEARDILSKGISVAKSLGNMESVIISLGNLGFICTEQGQYALSIKHLTQAIQLLEKFPNAFIHARVVYNIGLAHAGLNQWEAARENYTDAYQRTHDTNDIYLQAKSLLGVAQTLHAQGDTNIVRATAQKALLIAQTLPQTEVAAECSAFLARI